MMIDISRDLAPTLGLNLRKSCTGCLRGELSISEIVVDMPEDHGSISPEQIRHLLSRQPYRVLIKAHIQTQTAIRGTSHRESLELCLYSSQAP